MLGVVACLRVAALFARVVDDGVGLDVAFVEFLHVRTQACAKTGGEGCGLGGCGDGLAGGVCGLLVLRSRGSAEIISSPLFCAPQTSQFRYVLRLVLVSRRLPQSVQKTRDPMAAIIAVFGLITWKKCCL